MCLLAATATRDYSQSYSSQPGTATSKRAHQSGRQLWGTVLAVQCLMYSAQIRGPWSGSLPQNRFALDSPNISELRSCGGQLEMSARTRKTFSRSETMGRIKGRDTRPEILLRQHLWRRGLRYRVNMRVAGTRPDVAFISARLAVFVDGCFWHACPIHGTQPSTNAEYWQMKLARNVARDLGDNRSLSAAGWRVLRFWEHEIVENAEAVATQIAEQLRPRDV